MADVVTNAPGHIPKRCRHVDGEKRCTRCKEWWPAEKAFFFGDRNEADGLRRICKACYAETPCIIRRRARGAIAA